MHNLTPRICLLIALFTLTLSACKRQDDAPAPLMTYSGFKVDGVVYAVDSLVKDTTGPGSRARLYSSSGGGGMVLIETNDESWPLADTNYYYIKSEHLSERPGEMSISFFEAGQATPSFFMHSPQALSAPVGFVSRSGKWSPLTIGYSSNYPHNHEEEHFLGVNYYEP